MEEAKPQQLQAKEVSEEGKILEETQKTPQNIVARTLAQVHT